MVNFLFLLLIRILPFCCRDTPTSSGPNSFGKTKHGFSDAKKLFEKNLKEAMESALADD